MYSHRVPPNAVALRQNLHRRNYQFTKTGDAMRLLTLAMPHLAPPPNLAVFAHPLMLLLSGFLVEHTFCNIRNHPSMFFFFTSLCGRALPWEALQMNFLWSGSGFIHEKTHITHANVHTITLNTHMYRRNFCLPPLWSSHARAACVLLNPILKERFTPHVWEALGIGRERAHKDTYTNTIYMPDAMFSHLSKQTHLGTWNSIAVCLLLLVKQYFYTSAVPLHGLFTLYNRREGFSSGLLHCWTIVWVLPHFDFFFFFPLPLALPTSMYDSRSSHTEGPSKPEVLGERKAEDQRDSGMGG